MARNFNGSASITLATGGLGSFTFGTMVALCRRTDNNNWHGIVTTIQAGGGANEVYLDIAPSSHASAGAIWSSFGGVDNSGTLKFLAADGWCVVAATKASGSQTPRYHKYVVSSATWTHQNGGGAVSDGTATSTGTEMIGAVATDMLNGDVAAVALYSRVLADQEIESLAGAWETWLSYQPAGAWLLDSDAVNSLIDWTGAGANQSAVTGTTVQAASVPGWSQSDGAWPATIVLAAGGTDATVSPSTVAAVATVGTASLATGANLAASTVSATATVGTPTLRLDSTVGAGTVAAAASVGTASLRADQTVPPSTVAATATVGATAPATGETVSPATVAGAATVGSATLSTAEVVSPARVAAVATVPTPTITTGGSTTVAAGTVAAATAVGAPSLSTGERVTATTVLGAATVPAVTVQVSRTAAAVTVALAATVGSGSVATGMQAAAVTVAVLATVPAPTLTAAAAALVGVLTAGSAATSSMTTTSRRTGGPA